MRTIDSHKVNPVNDLISITVMDEPGAGGASHIYAMSFPSLDGTPIFQPIGFQNGPIAEAGVNGVTQEALLAIVADRLQSFQGGPFANDYNAAALGHVQSALGVLLDRTRERMSRGVEGTHKV